MRLSTRTLKITARVSLGLFVALLTLTTISFWWRFGIDGSDFALSIDRGYAIAIVAPEGVAQWSFAPELSAASESTWHTRTVWLPEFSRNAWWTHLIVPLWIPAAMCLAVGVTAIVKVRRLVPAFKYIACVKCGYALTGLSVAAPCPGCGRTNPTLR